MFLCNGLSLFLFFSCSSEKEDTSSQDWWNNLEDENQIDDKENDDKDNGDKEEYEEYEECASDFDSTQTCEGSWEDTICKYDDLIWWCQDGIWMNEEEK